MSFQVHGVDDSEQTVVRRQLQRDEMEKFFNKLAPTRIGVEACGAPSSLALSSPGATAARSGGLVKAVRTFSLIEYKNSAGRPGSPNRRAPSLIVSINAPALVVIDHQRHQNAVGFDHYCEQIKRLAAH